MHLETISSRLGARQFAPAGMEAQAATVLKRTIDYAVAIVFEVALQDLRAPTRGCATTAFARQAAMYLAHVAGGLTFTDIGRVFARDRTTVAHACAVVEDRRDDPRVDRTLDIMEAVVGRLAHVTLFGSAQLN